MSPDRQEQVDLFRDLAESGLGQASIARALRVSRQAVQLWAQGEKIGVANIPGLARVAGMSVTTIGVIGGYAPNHDWDEVDRRRSRNLLVIDLAMVDAVRDLRERGKGSEARSRIGWLTSLMGSDVKDADEAVALASLLLERIYAVTEAVSREKILGFVEIDLVVVTELCSRYRRDARMRDLGHHATFRGGDALYVAGKYDDVGRKLAGIPASAPLSVWIRSKRAEMISAGALGNEAAFQRSREAIAEITDIAETAEEHFAVAWALEGEVQVLGHHPGWQRGDLQAWDRLARAREAYSLGLKCERRDDRLRVGLFRSELQGVTSGAIDLSPTKFDQRMRSAKKLARPWPRVLRQLNEFAS